MRERLYRWLALRLPHLLAYWAYVRISAEVSRELYHGGDRG